MSSIEESTAAPTAPLVADSAPIVRLVLGKGPQTGTTVLCRHMVTLIGSRDGCKVTLRHRHVSPVHVAVVNEGNDVFAVDMVTPHGTRLNGLKLQHERLTDGDLLSVGPWEFRVEIEQPARGGQADAQSFDLEPTPRVIALEHVETGRVLQPNRDICLIGRRNGCDITVADARVSRAHALLVNYFGYPAILDLLTLNHTYVNDAVVGFQVLKDKDVVTVGESQFRVRLVGSAVGERPSRNHKLPEPAIAPASTPTITLTADAPAADLINIHSEDRSQSWRIADNLAELEKVTRKKVV
jgi:predicted component of type VI protein secretion system